MRAEKIRSWKAPAERHRRAARTGAKVKEELSVSHKLELIRRKIYETFTEPGADQLGKQARREHFNVNLNVRIAASTSEGDDQRARRNNGFSP